MTQNTQRSSTRNDTRAGAQTNPANERGSTTNEPQISAERKNYLAETYGYSPEQVDVMRNVICMSATDAELEFFLAACKRAKLDPFARQIYFIKRPQKVEDAFGNSSWVPVGKPEVSIDGLRAGAEMTGEYEGQGAMQWCGPDGKWKDVWLDDKAAPAAAKATIYRRGQREPLVNVALYREFCPVYRNGQSPEMWKKMGANQLAKCAEAGGLRRAFPRDLSGLYTDTEMEHVSVSAQSYSAPTGTKDANVIEAGAQPALPAGEPGPIAQLTDADKSDLDEMLKVIRDARDRNAVAPVGARITAAKKKKEENRSPIEREIMLQVEPALTKKWRELPPVGAKALPIDVGTAPPTNAPSAKA